LAHDSGAAGTDGGLTKTGAGTLTVSVAQNYNGPTVVAAGTLFLPAGGSLSNATALTVSPGAALRLDTSALQTVALSGLSLGGVSPAYATLAFSADGLSNDVLAVSGTLTLGQAALTLLTAGTASDYALNGTYTLFTYTGAAPAVDGLSVANRSPGKTYTFAAASGAVTLTIGTDTAGADGTPVWTATGGGAWRTSANWSIAPGTGGAGQPVRFDASISAPATVALSGGDATVGKLFFNNANAYTLAGASKLIFDGGTGTQSVLAVEVGTHALTLPATVSTNGLQVRLEKNTSLVLGGVIDGPGSLIKTGLGDLTVTNAQPRTGTTEMRSAALEVGGAADFGSGSLIFNGGAGIRVVNTNRVTLTSPLVLATGIQFNTRDADLALAGALTWQSTAGTLTKVGSNTLNFAGSGTAVGTPKFYLREGGLSFASGASYDFTGATRESIRLGLAANTKTSLTIENGAKVVLGGLTVSADSSGTAGSDALITQNGGSLTLVNTNGDSGTAFYLRDYGTAPAAYVLNGGAFAMAASAWANLGNYGPAYLTVNGGTMSLGRFAAGYQNSSNTASGSSLVAVKVNGGRLEATGSWSWTSDGTARFTDVTVNGGTLALPVTRATRRIRPTTCPACGAWRWARRAA
jgi:autotransporter-associated beta strand protein